MPNFTVTRPRPLQPEWGEVIYQNEILVSGKFTNAELIQMAQEKIQANNKPWYSRAKDAIGEAIGNAFVNR